MSTVEKNMDSFPPKWRLDKHIPIALLLAIALQTGGGIWWLAQLSAKIDRAVDTINEFKVERYTKDDAKRDNAYFTERDREHERRLEFLEDSIFGNRQRSRVPQTR
jgi:hypothetical protein